MRMVSLGILSSGPAWFRVHSARFPRVARFHDLRLLGLARRKLFQDFERNFLRLAVMGKIVLKFPVQFDGFARIVLRSEDHVAQPHWVRQYRIFFQFIERRFYVVRFHRSSSSHSSPAILLRNARQTKHGPSRNRHSPEWPRGGRQSGDWRSRSSTDARRANEKKLRWISSANFRGTQAAEGKNS